MVEGINNVSLVDVCQIVKDRVEEYSEHHEAYLKRRNENGKCWRYQILKIERVWAEYFLQAAEELETLEEQEEDTGAHLDVSLGTDPLCYILMALGMAVDHERKGENEKVLELWSDWTNDYIDEEKSKIERRKLRQSLVPQNAVFE